MQITEISAQVIGPTESITETKTQTVKPIKTTTQEKIQLLREFPLCTYNGIEFPYSSCNFSVTQQLVKHKFPKLNGNLIESVSSNGEIISITIPAFNSTYRGIYPKLMDELKDLKDSKKPYILTHTHGTWYAYISSLSENQAPDSLDGVIINVTFETTIKFDPTLREESKSRELSESEYVEVANKIKTKIVPQKQQQFSDDVSLLSTIQSASNTVQRTIGKIDITQKRLINKFKNAQFAVRRVIDATQYLIAQNQLYYAQFVSDTRNIETFILESLSKLQGQTNFTVKLQRRTTVHELILQYKMKYTDFVRLNSSISNLYVLPAGTVVSIQRN